MIAGFWLQLRCLFCLRNVEKSTNWQTDNVKGNQWSNINLNFRLIKMKNELPYRRRIVVPLVSLRTSFECVVVESSFRRLVRNAISSLSLSLLIRLSAAVIIQGWCSSAKFADHGLSPFDSIRNIHFRFDYQIIGQNLTWFLCNWLAISMNRLNLATNLTKWAITTAISETADRRQNLTQEIEFESEFGTSCRA